MEITDDGLLRWRYLTARVTSENFVAIPTRAEIHIQKTAPGPPIAIAPETPAMLPVPIEAASAVHIALKGETAPDLLSVFLKDLPAVFFMMCPNLENWINPSRTLINRPTPIMRIIAGMPQTISLTVRSMPPGPNNNS